MTKRTGGGLRLSDNRIGVPMTDLPGRRWMNALRESMSELLLSDQTWQSLAQSATSDEVDGHAHIVLDSPDADTVNILVSYVMPLDEAIAAANNRVWHIVEGPQDINPADRDSRVFGYRIKKGAQTRTLLVAISNTLLASGPDGRDLTTAAAIETDGRSLVQEALERSDQPPKEIQLSTRGIWETPADNST